MNPKPPDTAQFPFILRIRVPDGHADFPIANTVGAKLLSAVLDLTLAAHDIHPCMPGSNVESWNAPDKTAESPTGCDGMFLNSATCIFKVPQFQLHHAAQCIRTCLENCGLSPFSTIQSYCLDEEFLRPLHVGTACAPPPMTFPELREETQAAHRHENALILAIAIAIPEANPDLIAQKAALFKVIENQARFMDPPPPPAP